MKHHIAAVVPAPAPVQPSHINFTTAYVVVRNDGLVKIFDTLMSGADPKENWDALQNKYMLGNSQRITHETILIPLDIFSAVRLGLVSMHELDLPEGAKALLNIIK